MKSAAAAIITYCVVALAIFGDAFAPAFFLTVWSDRLGVPFWRIFALGCTALCASVFLLPRGWQHSLPSRLSLFVALSIITPTASLGFYSDLVRQQRLADFDADELIEHSFFRSIREAPRESQLFLHSGALKDCVAYGWSYRTMSLYELSPNVAQNVVPHSLNVDCRYEDEPTTDIMSAGVNRPKLQTGSHD